MHNIRVHLDLAADLPTTAADPHQLQQVFLNMVNNAVDAILDKSSDGDLWVSTGQQDQRLLVEFTDSGPGVKDPLRVFDPFYTTKPVGKGTGLGLSICYGIVTEHGGSIRVKNLPPRGASFTIEIPCQEIAAVKTGEAQKTTKNGDRAKILLVDPETSVLEAVQAMLKNHEHQVFSARTLEEAQILLRSREFDLVLSDVEVSGRKGSKGLREWIERERASLSDRLIVMCALAESSQSTGITDELILQKPFDALQLLAAIDSVLNRAKSSTIS
jgi:two-component system NtrC family sensor kinase